MLPNFNEDFIKDYSEENDKGHFLGVNVHYIKKLRELHNDLSFLPKIMIIEKHLLIENT